MSPHVTTQILIDVVCYKCGILFAMPNEYAMQRKEDGRTWWCPNGHRQHFYRKSDSPEMQQLKREKLQAIHRAEQAEAAATEAGNPLPEETPADGDTGEQLGVRVSDPKAVAEMLGGAVKAKNQVRVERDAKTGNLICPHCQKRYNWRTSGHLDNHLRRKHGDSRRSTYRAWERVGDDGKGADHA